MGSSLRSPVAKQEVDELTRIFYTTERLGAVRLSDGGGPLGFDVTAAFQLDALLIAYDCDGIVETGTFLGDSTAYFSRRYPQLPVRSIEIDPTAASVAKHRLRSLSNCQVYLGNSAELLPKVLREFRRPLVYLDAHWGPSWPLEIELQSVRRGVICVDDFDINHPRFGYDSYGGVSCNASFIARARPDLAEVLVGNPFADYPVPCLQVGRRTGTAYLVVGLQSRAPSPVEWFHRIGLRDSPITYPEWPDGQTRQDHAKP